MASHRQSPPAPFPQWPVLKITKKASSKFLESLEAEGLDPENTYLRVGAKPGGCSGWTFTIGTEDTVDPTDTLFESTDGINMLIDTHQLEEVIGSLEVDYKDDNLVEQGFVFHRLGSGQMCGCGESFVPLGSNKSLGWEQ